MEKNRCMLCGEQASEHKIKEIPFTYKGQSVMINQPGKWCDACGEGVLNNKDMKATEKEMQEHKARVDGLLPPDEIRRIRKKLKLSQQEAAKYFGGGVNAFGRYERGVNPVPKALSGLLKILNNHPNQLKELKGAHETKIEGRKPTPGQAMPVTKTFKKTSEKSKSA